VTEVEHDALETHIHVHSCGFASTVLKADPGKLFHYDKETKGDSCFTTIWCFGWWPKLLIPINGQWGCG